MEFKKLDKVLLVVALVSLVIIIALATNLPQLKSGYTYKKSYLIGYCLPGLLPLIASISILILRNSRFSHNKIILPNFDIVKQSKEKFSNSNKSQNVDKFKNEEKFYDLIWEEIEQKNLKRSVWTKAIADADGDIKKAEAIYIRLRLGQLMKN